MEKPSGREKQVKTDEKQVEK